VAVILIYLSAIIQSAMMSAASAAIELRHLPGFKSRAKVTVPLRSGFVHMLP
jgi:hypothetical protein